MSDGGLTTTADVKWRRAEFVFDWETLEIRFYFANENDESITTPFYYQDIDSANGLMFYNLKPGSVSYFKDVIVSDEIPENRKFAKIVRTGFGVILTLFFMLKI